MTDVAEPDAGIASGLLSTFQAVGGTLGVAALAAVAARVTEDRAPTAASANDALLAGFAPAFLIAGGLAVLAVLTALLTSPRQ
jgi:hypothetical protein